MKVFKFIALLSFIYLSFSSCSNDDEPTLNSKTYTNSYKIRSIQSASNVDLNNTGISSNDLLDQVESRQSLSQSTATYVYTPNTNTGVIMIPYPFQSIISENTDSPYLSFFVVQYPSFSYKLDKNNEIVILEVYNDYQFARYGTVKSASKIDDNSFKVIFTASLYDFDQKKRVDSDVAIIFEKIIDDTQSSK